MLFIDGNKGSVGINTNTVPIGYRAQFKGGKFRFYHDDYALNFWLASNCDPRIWTPSGKIVFYDTPSLSYVDIQCGTLYQNSDINNKEGINELNGTIQKVNQLQGVSFYWKKDSLHTKKQIGLIAQEVETVIPEVVCTDDSTGGKCMNYSGIIPYLIEAIKEQQTQIEDLEQQISDCCSSEIKNKNLILNDETGNNTDSQSTRESKLYQNVPNPFYKTTKIKYTATKSAAQVSLLIF